MLYRYVCLIGWRRVAGHVDCAEWVKLLSTQSNEVCEGSTKKTISPEHVTEALKVYLCLDTAGCEWTGLTYQQLGFESFISEVEESNVEFKQSQKVGKIARPKRTRLISRNVRGRSQIRKACRMRNC